jgi:hypothetical protein
MRHSSLSWKVGLCLWLVACGSGDVQAIGGTSSSGTTGGTGAGTGTGAGGAGGTTTAGGGGAAAGSSSTGTASTSSSSGPVDAGVVCADAGLGFPAAYKACAVDADCIQEGVTDCCTTYDQGVAKAAMDAWNAYRSACFHVGPVCPCSLNSAKIVTDDGQSSPINTTTQVACKAGLCSTYVP